MRLELHPSGDTAHVWHHSALELGEPVIQPEGHVQRHFIGDP